MSSEDPDFVVFCSDLSVGPLSGARVLRRRILMSVAFDNLLSWLSPDREEAAQQYEKIRRKLTGFFVRRGCCHCEELADKTFERVEKLLAEGKLADYEGDPILFFYGVARKIYREELRVPVLDPRDFIPRQPVGTENEFSCLDQCLDKLDEDQRYLITHYYDYQEKNKIKSRQTLADELGIGMNNLRLRAMRIRTALRECVSDCVHNIERQ